ncbi:hypothetical protein CEXT_676531 [Caerostris extrusa]|uniref:Uncharacterized protein n=1 Tax=Caerostris extrusa TaxID=172846 RepID=A0AAV4U3G4_CAEEX|nr:hypothetical protein CEXT_676531 [Caerostris extrusa]
MITLKSMLSDWNLYEITVDLALSEILQAPRIINIKVSQCLTSLQFPTLASSQRTLFSNALACWGSYRKQGRLRPT